MSHINVICLRVHTTEKNKRKQGLTVITVAVAATCGHHWWDWTFPLCSHKQQTHCLVGVFSHIWNSNSIMQIVYTTSCSSRFCGHALEKRHTEIGPVLEVKTFCHLDVHGSGIQTSSTSGVDTNAWGGHIRGSNRHVDESRYKDPQYFPGRLEEVDSGSTQETHAQQPTIQSRPSV